MVNEGQDNFVRRRRKITIGIDRVKAALINFELTDSSRPPPALQPQAAVLQLPSPSVPSGKPNTTWSGTPYTTRSCGRFMV